MANQQNNTPITQSEVDSFAQKLEQWGSGLPAKEQALLHLMLARVNRAACRMAAEKETP